MVKGLDLFRKFFASYSSQYVLIGGTAASLAMEEAGLEFRSTKDLDIVLYMEALNPEFGRAFWSPASPLSCWMTTIITSS